MRGIPLLSVLPALCFTLMWCSMTAALARPVLPSNSEHQVIETRDIIVAMDISGSMDSTMDTPDYSSYYGNPGRMPPSKPGKRKIDVAAESIREFIKLRKDDRIALAVFDDDTYWHWPLSDDHSLLIKKTFLLNKYTGAGTNFDGPTEYQTGTGPIQAAIDHFRQYGQSRSRVFVLVTDGSSTIEAKRFEQLASQMQQLGIHMYVIGVGSDWTSSTLDTSDLRRFVERLHGKTMTAGNAQAVQDAMGTINRLEKTQVKLERETTHKDVYLDFLIASIVFAFGS
jgi:Ca-activated chloride channel family protein